MPNRGERVGQQLGNYRIERLLAQGGFGDVYLGEHIHLGTQAAIKVLNAQIVQEDRDQFRTEARTIARLIHPHIVRTLEFGVEDATPFLVMDHATNGTLRQRHPKGSRVPLSSVVAYVRQLAEALQYAHDTKLIHRDIKPENMLIGRHGELLLSDFGIALIAQSSRYQGASDMAGTIGYMAPEQIQARPVLASDQYALGIVVYEWLCGDRPFHGSFTEVAAKHSIATPPSLREKVTTISSDVEQVVMTALAKDPQRRFASVQAFAKALEQASQEGLETVYAGKPEAQLAIRVPSVSPLSPASSAPSEKVTPVLESAATVASDEKSVQNVNNDTVQWTINMRKPFLLSSLVTLGSTLLCGILLSQLDLTVFVAFSERVHYQSEFPLDILGPIILFGLFSAIPLFIGTTFGPVTGILTGGLAFIIGTYFSPSFGLYDPEYTLEHYYAFIYSNDLWLLLLYMLCIGLFAGLALLKKVPRTTTQRLIIASVCSFAAVMIATMLIIVTGFAALGYSYSFLGIVLLLTLMLPGPVLQSFLFGAYVTFRRDYLKEKVA